MLNEILNYLQRLRVPSAVHFRLHDFKFDDIHFEDDDTLKVRVMFFLENIQNNVLYPP